jgi:hypothetical protein
MTAAVLRAEEPGLNAKISTAMIELYAAFYGHDRTTATTCCARGVSLDLDKPTI